MNILLISLALAGGPGPDTVPIFEGLGNHSHPISTTSDRTQAYFDQGVRLVYGFNHAEAIRSFTAALESDPNCAMCYWGIAFAAGPNINATMDAEGGTLAFEALNEAMTRMDGASTKEKMYIDALARRYGAEVMEDRAQRDSAFAAAMEEVANAYPNDADAQVWYADALMNLAPWDYWKADLSPREGTQEILQTLERVVSREPDHAGACHLYIHAVEKADPHKAEPCADRLPALMPGAGHIVHMPAHIYIRVGRYADAIELNHHATHADSRYIHAEKPRGLYPMAYYPHNYDFLAFAAAMAGRSDEALAAARSGAEAVDTDMMGIPELGGLQNYYVLPLRMMVRFGMWNEILSAPAPSTDLDFPQGFWNYARGIALLRTGDAAGAELQLEALRQRVAADAIEPVYIWWNPAREVLRLGALALTAEIEMSKGNVDAALNTLARAIEVEDSMTYDEPPPWTVPTRQVLGNMLLAAGDAKAAQETFEADLERHPENGWSLLGLGRALVAQGETEAAAAVDARLRRAWSTADPKLRDATVF